MHPDDLFFLFLASSALQFILIIILCIFVLQHDQGAYATHLIAHHFDYIKNKLRNITTQLLVIADLFQESGVVISNSNQDIESESSFEDPPPPYSDWREATNHIQHTLYTTEQ